MVKRLAIARVRSLLALQLFSTVGLALSALADPIVALPLVEGSGPGQVGIDRGDTRAFDTMPSFKVDAQGRLIVSDGLNERVLIVDSGGALLTTIQLSVAEAGGVQHLLALEGGRLVTAFDSGGVTTLVQYDYTGKELRRTTLPSGSLFAALEGGGFVYLLASGGQRYRVYDAEFGLLDQADQPPGELGSVRAAEVGEERTLVIAEYPDRCFAFVDAGAGFDSVQRFGDALTVLAPSSIWTVRIDSAPSGVLLPESEYGPDPLGDEAFFEADVEPDLIVQYRDLQIGADGEVYALRNRPEDIAIVRFDRATLPPATEGIEASDNTPPEFTPVPAAKVIVGTKYEVVLEVDDADGDYVVTEAASLPEGARFDEMMRLLRWTPAEDQLGLHQLVIRARDSGCGETELTIQVEVVEQP